RRRAVRDSRGDAQPRWTPASNAESADDYLADDAKRTEETDGRQNDDRSCHAAGPPPSSRGVRESPRPRARNPQQALYEKPRLVDQQGLQVGCPAIDRAPERNRHHIQTAQTGNAL